MQVDLASTSICVHGTGVVQHGLRLLEASIDSGIHSVVQGAGHLRGHMIGPVIVGLVLPSTWSWWHTTRILLRKYGACVHLRVYFAVDGRSQRRIPVNHVDLKSER